MGILIRNLAPKGTIKTKSTLPIPPVPTIFEVIIIELFGKQSISANSCAVNELELYNNTSKTTYNTANIDVYDSVTNGLPNYWNSTFYWNKSNLNDNIANYKTNTNPSGTDGGGQNSTLFMHPTTLSTSWARLAIFPSSPANRIKIHCGSTGIDYYRLPIKVKVYGTTPQDYNKTTNIDNRQDTNLIFLGEKEYALADSHQWFYIG